MNTEWLKEATNEELVEELDICLQRLHRTKVFTVAHSECYAEVKLIKAEILKRMK